MNRFVSRLAAATAASVLPLAAAAAVVFDGGAPNQSILYYADTSQNYVIAGTQVTFAAPVTFDAMTWWGGYVYGATGATDDFLFAIYEPSPILPSAAPLVSVDLGAVTRTATGAVVGGTNDEYRYDASFASITLAAGTYYLTLSNREPSASIWGWETTSGGPREGGLQYISPPGNWSSRDGINLAYQLAATPTVPIPEPATGWMLAVGLLAIGARMQRRARSG